MTMARLSLRSIAAHKLRLFLTILAVVLGTAFVSGSMMFTSSLNNVFDSAVSNELDGVDAVVTSESGPLTSEQINQITDDPNVDRVNINSSTSIVLANPDRTQIGGKSVSGSLVPWYAPEDAVSDPVQVVEGSAPRGVEQIAVDKEQAEKNGISLGQRVLAVDPAGQHELEVVGLTTAESRNPHGVSAYMAADGYQELYSGGAGTRTLMVAGTNPDQVVEQLSSAYPDLKVEAGDALAEEITGQIKQALSFVNYFLIAFGLIALLVGTFIIANTFAMIVAQRIKEFALLRALGVSRTQLTGSVVLEAAFVGLVGSAIGVVAGFGLVQALQAIFAAMDMPLDNAGLGLTPTSIIVPIILGMIVTVVSAWAPARKAGAVRPVEAMRSTETASESSLKVRTVLGAIAIVAGIAAAVAGVVSDWATKTAAISVGAGAFLVIVGVFLASPAISIPVVGGIGRAIGAPFGAVGKLAATNSKRNPRRTATTAFALTLGVALVSVIGMLSSTMSSSIEDLVATEVKSDYVLSGPQNGSFPIPAEVPEKVAETEGVDNVTTFSYGQVAVGEVASLQGPGGGLTTLATGNASDSLNIKDAEGDFDLNEPNRLVVNKDFAAKQGWSMGQTLPIVGTQGEQVAKAKIVGLYGESQLMGTVVLSAATLEGTAYEAAQNTFAMLVDGESENLRADLEKTVADYLVVRVQTAEEFAGEQVAMINQMLYILYALLGLSVIVAILGIINTLALNVIERRQEIGMLRAVGTARRQVRTMITVESVQIAIYGALVGIIVGVGLGWAFLKVLAAQGLDKLTIPWEMLGLMLVASAVVGVVAALWPAAKASRTPPLEAIAD